jgi:hypothetical protein
MRSIETVLSLTLKDGSNLKYPKNSLSGIGHIIKMCQILLRAQLWFGLGTIPDVFYPSHEHASSLEHDHVSRTTGLSLIPLPLSFNKEVAAT